MPTRTDTLPPHRRAAFTRIDIAIDGPIWGIEGSIPQRHTGDGVFTSEGDIRYPETRLTAIAVAPTGGQVWGINSRGQPVIWQPGSMPNWVQKGVDADSYHGAYVDIDAAADGTICALRRSGGFRPTLAMRLDQDTWTPMTHPRSILDGETFARIAVGSATSVYALDPGGAVFRYQVDSQSWTKVVDLFDDGGNPQAVMSIMAGSDGVVWGVAANHRVYSLASGGTAWKQTIGWGPLSEIAGPDSYHLIGLTPEKTDRDGDAYNDIWLGLGGPPGTPLPIVPPPPPPVATFASPAVPVTNGALSAPALTAYNRKLYVAYQGGEGDARGGGGDRQNWHQLCVRAATSHAFSQYGFTAMRTFGGILMGSAPALAAMGGALYAAYQANDPRNIPYVTRTYDGDNWWPPQGLSPIPLRFPGGGTRDVGLNIPMGSAPALAEFGGRLYCAFQEDGPHRLMMISSSDGNIWTTFLPSDPGAGSPAVGVAGILIGSAPALAVFNGRLYCAFQANDPSHTLFVTSSSDGDNWKSPANGIPGIAIGSAPGLAALDGRLYCAYQADDGSRVLCVTTSTDGERWGPPTRYENMQPAGGVTLCAVDRNLFVGFNGIADMYSYVSIASV